MPGALPLLLVAILTPAGTWQVGTPVTSATTRPALTGAPAAAVTESAIERSIVVRGQDSRGAMPGSAPTEGSAAAPEGRRPVAFAVTEQPGRVASRTSRARGPPR